MTQFTISGIDVSKHQGDIDVQALMATPQRFCIVKATEGRGYTDPRFFETWRKLCDAEPALYRGAYHFARPDSIGGAADGEAEARDFCNALKAAGNYMEGALPPVLDYEKYSGKGTAANIAFIDAFLKTVEDMLGRQPMIYTGDAVWRYQTGNTDKFTDYPLWLVEYSKLGRDGLGYPEAAMAKLPWKHPTLWQWSGGGDWAYGKRIDGLPWPLDLNWFNGDAGDLDELALVDDPDAPEDQPRWPAPNIECLLRVMSEAETEVEDALNKVRGVRALIEEMTT